MPIHLQMIEVVAEGLGDLVDECVFVGGATTVLYLDNRAGPEPRPTDDVDCIIEIANFHSYQELEHRLRKAGFSHDRRPHAPICRWIYAGVTVDVMPTDERILGFSNRWYAAGIKHRIPRTLPNGKIISTFTLPFFIATKLEAYRSRGQNDPRMSSDIEDIFFVLDGVNDPISQIAAAPTPLREYLSDTVSELTANRDFQDAVEIHLGREGVARVDRAKALLQQIATNRLS